jgi:periplasmic divalent cation tolerance protein
MNDAGDSGIVAVLTTAPSAEVGERIAEALVGERLAACANLLPAVRSIFRWQGEVQRESEVLVLLKTTRGALEALRGRLVDLHPYDVPEVLALDVRGGHAPYLDWVRSEVGGGG